MGLHASQAEQTCYDGGSCDWTLEAGPVNSPVAFLPGLHSSGFALISSRPQIPKHYQSSSPSSNKLWPTTHLSAYLISREMLVEQAEMIPTER